MTNAPTGWIRGPLRKFAPLQRGFDLPASEVVPGNVPVVYSNGVGRYHNHAMVKGPGVVTGRSGTIGRVHFVEGSYWPHNTALWVTDFKQCSPRYVYYLLQAVGLERFAGGSGVPTLNRNDAHSFEVSVPGTRDEQIRIADALTDADDLIASLERFMVKKQALEQGMLQELLRGKTRLPSFTGGWRQLRLGEVATFSKGMGLPRSAIIPGGRLQCVHYGELFTHYGPEVRFVTSRTNDSSLRVRSVTNDVLMPTSDVTPRGLAKASALMTNGVVLGGDILIIRSDPSQVFGPFLAHVIRLDANQVLQLVRGSTVYHLYAADMRTFQLTLPPVDEQRAICEVLRDADHEIDSLQARLAKAHAIKIGMMQQLLTGRVRLPAETAS